MNAEVPTATYARPVHAEVKDRVGIRIESRSAVGEDGICSRRKSRVGNVKQKVFVSVRR